MTKLYEADNHILLCTGYAAPAEHCHRAAHIIISMKSGIRVVSDGAEYLCYGIVIPSGITHFVDTYEKDVLVFLYDCTSNVAKQIQDIRCIPKESCNDIAQWYAVLEQNCTSDDYRKFENSILARLGITDSAPLIQDERIISAMEYIRSQFVLKISCQEVANVVRLSQGRFSHLFKEQVGMTFSAYLIYQRIMHVYAAVLHGKSITEAALEAGFSSSSHFADVNHRVFGLPASTIIHNLIFAKI